MITIKQMADQIGVSPTTISNVLHGKINEVSQSTVEKVMRVIEESHYVPNMTARNLARNKTHIIGVILCFEKDVGAYALADPFNGELIGSIASAIEKRKFYMMLHITSNEEEAIHLALSWNVDGLIVCSMHMKEWRRISEETHKPVVFVDSYFGDGRENYANVGLDDRGGAYEITSYLIKCGHKKIAFSSDNLKSVDYERFEGYQLALHDHHIRYCDKWYLPLPPSPPAYKKALNKILNRRKEFTAIFFASDYYASLAVNYFQDHGLKIPEDISIVGFDDNIFSKIIRPALTTMHQDPSQKGTLAVSLLIQILDGNPPDKCNIRLPVKLVKRNSVRIVK